MMSPNGKTVALVNPLWIGHHPMYFTQFTASFLRAGANVIGLCPDPADAMRELRSAVDVETAATLESRVHFHELPAGKRSFFNGRFEGDPIRTFSRWKNAADHLADAETTSGMNADLVYFPYLDSYLRFLPVPFIPSLLLHRPWAGLYLRNHHHGEPTSPAKVIRMLAKGDSLLKSDTCLGIGVLDERFIPAMQMHTGKAITAYPDVTQAGLPAHPFDTALEVRRRAKDRKIIGMIGLERRKGFLTLLRVAELAREKMLSCYFVCAGTFMPSQYTPSEQEMLEELAGDIASGKVGNLYFDPSAGRIRDEKDYNSLFMSFDIAWAAYEGFQGSSGTLSKAALFEIPCIASAGECIGHRVENYQLGITIPEGSAEHAFEAIASLADGKDSEGSPLAPRYEAYRSDHSLARLDKILADLVASV